MTTTITDTDQAGNEWGLQALVTRRDARRHPPGSDVFEAMLRLAAEAVARRLTTMGDRPYIERITAERTEDKRAARFTYWCCFGDDHQWDDAEWDAAQATAFADLDVPDTLRAQVRALDTFDPAIAATVNGYFDRHAGWEAATVPPVIARLRPAFTEAFTLAVAE